MEALKAVNAARAKSRTCGSLGYFKAVKVRNELPPLLLFN